MRVLASENQEAGLKSLLWDGKDNSGHTVPSGIYFYQLQAGEVSITRKMLLSR